MARALKSAQKSDFHLAKRSTTAAMARRMAGVAKKRDQQSMRSRAAINGELAAMRS